MATPPPSPAFLLAERLEAYAELDEAQKERLQALLQAEAYHDVEPLMKTTYERAGCLGSQPAICGQAPSRSAAAARWGLRRP